MTYTDPATKDPWNPSRKATARVKDPLPAPKTCRYCEGVVEIMSHERVYGRDYSDWPWLYRCVECDASVGMHPFTNIPLGVLADQSLRKTRMRVKAIFKGVCLQFPSRSDAYAALADAMGIPVGECHFGWFTEERCVQAEAALSVMEKPR